MIHNNPIDLIKTFPYHLSELQKEYKRTELIK